MGDDLRVVDRERDGVEEIQGWLWWNNGKGEG